MVLQHVYNKVSFLSLRINLRCSYSTSEKCMKKSVYISQSKDIYTNLALEDWIYRNVDFENRQILMLWQNEPCVVIGRHQNPWLEANISELMNITDQGVKFARRNSGGGTVFHDLGNLNLTFFTRREHYNRRRNLEIIQRSIFREFGIQVEISPREDLTLQGYKVSGTASKLGRLNAYHHCTLLVNSNKVHLSQALQKQNLDITTNATKSIKSKIINLCEESPNVSIIKLIKVIGWEYMNSSFTLTDVDGGIDLANKNEFKMVDPTDLWFPGLNEIRDQYSSWEWRYGKTPKFTISKSFTVPENLIHIFGKSSDLKVTVTVENGRINDVTCSIAPGSLSINETERINSVSNVIGQHFSEETLNSLELLLSSFSDDKDRFVTECLKQIMTCV